jgi:hypothetical protein
LQEIANVVIVIVIVILIQQKACRPWAGQRSATDP